MRGLMMDFPLTIPTLLERARMNSAEWKLSGAVPINP